MTLIRRLGRSVQTAPWPLSGASLSTTYYETNGPLSTPVPTVAVRSLHASPQRDNSVLLGGLGVAGAALSARYALQIYEAYKNRPRSEKVASSWKYRNFYDGPFEDKMTRREAALILGVRESASTERIRNAHRKLLILNHPDTGGSTFLATKINQAKEMLLSGSK
uniref:J domain-containing protein n=1 Tax=Hyaloperonospora arabidopsidis (strain Emoy2) TaxID=559515 RepID=M4BSV3_HYAAE